LFPGVGLKDGAFAVIAVVGNEGNVDVPQFMGGNTTSRAAVQSAPCLPSTGHLMNDEFCHTNATQQILLLYSHLI